MVNGFYKLTFQLSVLWVFNVTNDEGIQRLNRNGDNLHWKTFKSRTVTQDAASSLLMKIRTKGKRGGKLAVHPSVLGLSMEPNNSFM